MILFIYRLTLLHLLMEYLVHVYHWFLVKKIHDQLKIIGTCNFNLSELYSFCEKINVRPWKLTNVWAEWVFWSKSAAAVISEI